MEISGKRYTRRNNNPKIFGIPIFCIKYNTKTNLQFEFTMLYVEYKKLMKDFNINPKNIEMITKFEYGEIPKPNKEVVFRFRQNFNPTFKKGGITICYKPVPNTKLTFEELMYTNDNYYEKKGNKKIWKQR
jgi:hypothetical protein